MRAENGDLILRPVIDKGEAFLDLFSGFDESFIQALEDRDMTPPQDRDPL